jgi:hypothetical protein
MLHVYLIRVKIFTKRYVFWSEYFYRPTSYTLSDEWFPAPSDGSRKFYSYLFSKCPIWPKKYVRSPFISFLKVAGHQIGVAYDGGVYACTCTCTCTRTLQCTCTWMNYTLRKMAPKGFFANSQGSVYPLWSPWGSFWATYSERVVFWVICMGFYSSNI